MKSKKLHLNVKISADLKKALAIRAKEEGRDLSNLVRNILERDMLRTATLLKADGMIRKTQNNTIPDVIPDKGAVSA